MKRTNACLVVFALALVYSRAFVFGQQCSPLKGSFAEQCYKIGAYNQTFKLPYKLSKDGADTLSDFLSYAFNEMEHCTEGYTGELIACAFMFAPSCTGEGQGVKLPCKRVCSEFIKQCSNTTEMMAHFTGYVLGLCTILPNNTASSNECLEPPDFEKHYNPNTTGLLEASCAEQILPWCKDLNYTHTILPLEIQKLYYKSYYNKNFTGDPVVDAQFDNTSYVYHLDQMVKKVPQCARGLKKVICAERMPPCFPDEGLSYYTICSSTCEQIEADCAQDLVGKMPDMWIPECRLMSYPNGTSSHGYCKHTTWPNPHEWLHHLEKYFGEKPPADKPKFNVPVRAIVAGVVVSVVFIASIIAGVFLWRNRMLPWSYFGLKGDDVKELVTD